MGRKPMYGPGNTKGKAAWKKATKKTLSKPAKQATVALVKSVLSRELETKFRSQAPVIIGAYNGQITNADMISLVPRIVQTQPNDPGNSFERNGQKITPRKLNCKVYVSLTPNLARSTNIVVCWWALTHKSLKHFPDLAGNTDISTKLFKTGDFNETYGFDGTVLNSTFPVNTQEYTVLKKGRFLLGKNTGDVQDSVAAGNQPVYGNHIGRMIDFDVKCPAKFLYDPDSNTPRTVYYPNNFAPFIVFGYYHQDQTGADLANQDISITLRQSLWYDDA